MTQEEKDTLLGRSTREHQEARSDLVYAQDRLASRAEKMIEFATSVREFTYSEGVAVIPSWNRDFGKMAEWMEELERLRNKEQDARKRLVRLTGAI